MADGPARLASDKSRNRPRKLKFQSASRLSRGCRYAQVRVAARTIFGDIAYSRFVPHNETTMQSNSIHVARKYIARIHAAVSRCSVYDIGHMEYKTWIDAEMGC
jgi:hypothetical protein